VNGLDTTLYYTFSTIAQTLAGALGLVAAFTVIRISAFNQLLHNHADDLYVSAEADEVVTRHYIRGDKPALFKCYRAKHEEIKQRGGTGNPPQPYLNVRQEAILTESEAMLASKASLLADTGSALLVSVGVILACFLCLAVANWLKAVPMVAYASLVLVVAGAAYCLWSYVKLLRKALREA